MGSVKTMTAIGESESGMLGVFNDWIVPDKISHGSDYWGIVTDGTDDIDKQKLVFLYAVLVQVVVCLCCIVTYVTILYWQQDDQVFDYRYRRYIT